MNIFQLFKKKPKTPDNSGWELTLPRKRIGGRYEIYWRKEGGMGLVYGCVAQPQSADEAPYPCVLKTLKNEFLNNFNQINQFRMEADAWINLDKHDQIVHAYYTQEIEGKLYLVLDWILGDEQYGENLRGWIMKGGLTTQMSIDLAIQFCNGMIYASRKFQEMDKHFVHRDIKPENILIDKNKTLKITDFGLVNLALGLKGDFDTGILKTDRAVESPGVTKRGRFYGTPEYMSPEQFLNDAEVDSRSDIYSFGCVLYEMICGKRPFILPTSYPVTNRFNFYSINHLYEIAPEPKSLNSECPADLNRLILKCLEKEPDKRYDNFNVIQDELSGMKLKKGKAISPASQQLSAHEWLNKGDSFLTMEDPKQAIDCYNKVLEIDQSNEKAWHNKGRALGWINEFQEAMDCFKEAKKVMTVINLRKLSEISTLEASCLEGLGRFEEAIALHDESIETDNTNPNAWYSKGLTLSKHGDYEDAILCFGKCIKLEPDNFKAWSDNGLALYKIDWINESIACCDKAISIRPGYTPAWVTKGNALSKAGHFENALSCYDKALEIDPNDPIALGNRNAALGILSQAAKNNDQEEESASPGSNESVKTAPFQRILLLGKEYLLFETGEIAMPETVLKFKPPDAHLFEDGNVMQYGKKIGSRADIQVISKGEMEVDIKNLKIRFVNEKPFGR